MTSTRKTKRRRRAVGAKGSVANKRVRRVAGPTSKMSGAADRDDTAISAPLELDVDSDEATQLAALFAEPLHVDDDAIIADADSAGLRRRR